MNTKQVIKTLENIKGYCSSLGDCKKCIFFTANEECQLMEVAWTLYDAATPAGWNMDRIKRVIENEK